MKPKHRKRQGTKPLREMNPLADCQEEEYRSLALDIHDAVGQSLSSVLLRIKMIRAHTDSDDMLRSLQELETIVTDSLTEVRRISRVLRPVALETHGLIPGLERLCESAQEHTGIQCHFMGRWERSCFSRREELLIYRIVQEALTNAFLHGRAKNAHVAVSAAGRCFVLSVRDDGCGFDTKKNARGIGLRGMAERAGMLGGRLHVRSRPGCGTHILMVCGINAGDTEE